MPIFTRKGDQGTTGLLGGKRISKSDTIMDVLGTIDEADAALGVARSQCCVNENCEIIQQAQRHLWQLMGDIASVGEDARFQRKSITEKHVLWLEEKIEFLSEASSPQKGFIVPGDSYPAALLDVARTVVRRAERCMVAYTCDTAFHNPYVLQYLNRLSSLCYALELRELTGRDEGAE